MTIFLVVLVLCWVLPIIVARKLAKKKNRTRSGWTVATLFFGWFAVIVLGVLEKKSLELPVQGKVN